MKDNIKLNLTEEDQFENFYPLMINNQKKYIRYLQMSNLTIIIIGFVGIYLLLIDMLTNFTLSVLIVLSGGLFLFSRYSFKKSVHYYNQMQSNITEQMLKNIKRSKFMTNGRKDRYLNNLKEVNGLDKISLLIKFKHEERENQDLWTDK
ncbi:DUF5392 family protein [Bacillus sp. AR18-7]|uniref:DUF5392 family protein n=1 Tax=Bacillus sp. AR18-7 TaxID=2217821 RepID=UPI0011C95C5D|nr:DUF5392 family protein [Bacillus sp. AR18-7]TXR68297.1 hypothetical protein DN395_00200 [Bacillus sp. AR18-7]